MVVGSVIFRVFFFSVFKEFFLGGGYSLFKSERGRRVVRVILEKVIVDF